MRLALLAALLVLAGCAQRAQIPGREFEQRPERTLYQALREVEASETQRVAVLNAYDRLDANLKVMSRQSQELIAEWRRLDRRAPAFPELARGMSERWAALAAERLVVESAFERDVAVALEPAQWQEWQQLMSTRPLGGPGERGMMQAPRNGP